MQTKTLKEVGMRVKYVFCTCQTLYKVRSWLTVVWMGLLINAHLDLGHHMLCLDFSKIYEWESYSGAIRAKYYIPPITKQALWEDAIVYCRERTKVFDVPPFVEPIGKLID